eukprot:11971466-Alexandrium_andersonii.AAC.1
MTADMGTELGLAFFNLKDPRDTLPSWIQHGNFFGGDVESDSDGDGPRAMGPLLPCALTIPGALHILHNLAGDMEAKLG